MTSPVSARIRLLPGLEYVASARWAFAVGLGVGVAGRNVRTHYDPVATVIFTPW